MLPRSADHAHLRDCMTDLGRIVSISGNPSAHTIEAAKVALDGLLLHAAGHIAEAARLYGGFIDTFGSNSPTERN